MKKIFLLIAISALFLANTAIANACTCASLGTPTEELSESDAVFSGKVVDIAPVRLERYIAPNHSRVIFDVSRVWKGPKRKKLAVFTSRDGASCGYQFDYGDEVLVYAREGQSGEFNTGLCDRTRSLASANEDIVALGAGTPLEKLDDLPIVKDVELERSFASRLENKVYDVLSGMSPNTLRILVAAVGLFVLIPISFYTVRRFVKNKKTRDN